MRDRLDTSMIVSDFMFIGGAFRSYFYQSKLHPSVKLKTIRIPRVMGLKSVLRKECQKSSGASYSSSYGTSPIP